MYEATLAAVEAFDPADDDLAAKSRELILGLLRYSEAPFSRLQYELGHITCSALIWNPSRTAIVLIHHHRHRRWLLPGGHVEPGETPAQAARREAIEETGVLFDEGWVPYLAGLDVHGIPPAKGEPYHLHHDLVFAFQAAGYGLVRTEEAPDVIWCEPAQLGRFAVPPSIWRSAARK